MLKNRHAVWTRRLVIVCALLVLATFSGEAQTSQRSVTSHEAQEFYRIVRAEIDQNTECPSAMAYFRKLSARKQSNIAHTIVQDPDARIAYLGANWLIANGKMKEAIPALASIISSGRDQTQLKGRFGYEWVHGDEELFLEILINLSNFLLTRLDDFKGEDRARVERFLMGGMFKESTEQFSLEAARRRLAELKTAHLKLKTAK